MVRLSSDLHATMWISTKGLTKNEEREVVRVITDGVDQKNLIFYGYCFGKFDLIVEFVDSSAKVASNKVCELQEKISRSLMSRNPQIRDPVCSSLTLGAKISGHNTMPSANNSPIRIYTFLKPVNKYINLDAIVSNLNEGMEIFWNASAYSFLLTANGRNFHDTFSRILQYRLATEKIFSESCTYVGLHWERTDEECEKEIDSLVFVKLKSGFGELKLNSREREIWEIRKRLGWFDLSLKYKKGAKTLKELKEAILSLRQRHMRDIEGTSTILFPKGELSYG